MSQPLSFSDILYCHTPDLQEKAFSPRPHLSIRNCETPFHEVIRQERRNRPPRFLWASETPDVVVRLRAIPPSSGNSIQRATGSGLFSMSTGLLGASYNRDMAVRIEMQSTGDPQARGEIVAIIEHVLSDRPGEWRVSIVGSHANDNWEMKVEGPAGFERSYTLVGSAGEHEPATIGNLVVKLLRARKP